jgi:serine/threonine protein kinase
MSSLKFKCPNCNQKLEAEAALFGTHNICPSCHTDLRVPDSRLSPGIQIGDFILREKIGTGGMGEVWSADQPSMDRVVALKIIRAELADTPYIQERFIKEVRSSGRLIHPNIVTAFHAGCDNGIHYMAMEYVEGITLETRIKQGVLPEHEALKIVHEIASALDYVWRKFKIIHRDIKPSNIMLTSDHEVKLLDMGISRDLSVDSTTITNANIIIGTPHYMSPEQAENAPDIDCRSDIYALGVVLCEMLTGKPPYDAPSTVEIIAQHIFAPRPELFESSGISHATSNLVQQMMARERDKRFADWQSVLSRIKNPPLPPVQSKIKMPRRIHRIIYPLTALFVFCLLILALLIIAKKLKSQAQEPASPQQIDRQAPPREAAGSQQDEMRPRRRQHRRARLQDELGLSDTQADKVMKILEDGRKKAEEIRRSANGSENARYKLFQHRRKIMEQLKTILTEKQLERFKEIYAKMKRQRRPPPE